MILSLDIETYSSVDLAKSGVYAYAGSDDFEVLLLAYSIDGGPVTVIEGQDDIKHDFDLQDMLQDPDVTKTAWNAAFERTCLSKLFGTQLDPASWDCSMVRALMLGLPGSLEQVAEVLRLEEQKMKEGRALIRYFSVPCRPTKKNGGRTRNLAHHDPDKWQLFVDYCKQDVVTEMAIRSRLIGHEIPEKERALYRLDQAINDRGVRMDPKFVAQAIGFNNLHRDHMMAEARALSGLENPNSVGQLKGWIEEVEGIEIPSLTKAIVPTLIAEANDPRTVRMLEIRQALAKTSVAKYEAMERAVCADGRIRGLLQYYGANRTGRWAGRLVQVQNLPQNHIKELDDTRALLRRGDYEALEIIYDNPAIALSQLIRTAFIPSEGCRFIVADFSAIEARVIAWLAGEQWRMDVFNSHGKIYEASAAAMFGVPVESIGRGDPLRQKGKIAELALGYGGSVGALKQMGALDMGLEQGELKPLVDQWRAANPAIIGFWSDVEEAALEAVRERRTVKLQHGITFEIQAGFLFIRLPSGRRMAYARPRIAQNRFGRDAVIYEGMNQVTRKWEATETYGGKLVENIVQATARDCLAESMQLLDKAGYQIVMHVHDEVVLDVPQHQTDALSDVLSLMSKRPAWAPDLPLRADGYECPYYQKD